MHSLKRVVRIREVVGAYDLAGTINVRALRTGSGIGIVDREEGISDVQKAVPASIREKISAHNVC
jgi:hypothetical protein